MSDSDSLTPRQVRAIAALIAGKTVAAVAEEVGVSVRTISRYLADERFKSELRAAQDRAIDAAVSILSGGAVDAARTLVAIHKDRAVNPAVRVQAARAVLVENLKVRDQYEVAERLNRLETILEKTEPGGWR